MNRSRTGFLTDRTSADVGYCELNYIEKWCARKPVGIVHGCKSDRSYVIYACCYLCYLAGDRERETGDGCSPRGYWWSGRPAGHPDGRCAPDSSVAALPQNDGRGVCHSDRVYAGARSVNEGYLAITYSVTIIQMHYSEVPPLQSARKVENLTGTGNGVC